MVIPNCAFPEWRSRCFSECGCRAFLCSGRSDSSSALLSLSRSPSEKRVPSPELLVRGLLWLWVAIAYGVAAHRRAELAVSAGHAEARLHIRRNRKAFLCPDAFTNPAHVHFALKVTFAAMFCYIFYEAIDWSGIHTAFITCTFIALESTECDAATKERLQDRRLRDRRSARAFHHRLPDAAHGNDRVARCGRCLCLCHRRLGRHRKRTDLLMPGLQIAFAFFYSVFQGYAPDTDLDNVRNRVVGILFGLIVTGLVFQYIWPERTIDRLRDALRAALRQLAKLLEIPRPDVSIEKQNGSPCSDSRNRKEL